MTNRFLASLGFEVPTEAIRLGLGWRPRPQMWRGQGVSGTPVRWASLGIPTMVSKLKRFANCKAGGLSRAQKPSTGYESRGLHASYGSYPLLGSSKIPSKTTKTLPKSRFQDVPSVPTLNFDPVPTAPPPPVPPLATQCRLRPGAEAALHRDDGAVQVQREATQGLAPVEGEGQHLGRHGGYGGYGYGLGPLFDTFCVYGEGLEKT